MNASRANQNDGEIGAVGISTPGELDEDRLNAWVAELLVTKGENIVSTKGVLAVHGSERRLIVQGVNQYLETRFERMWGPRELRGNSLLLIGRNLDRTALHAGLQSCLAEAGTA